MEGLKRVEGSKSWRICELDGYSQYLLTEGLEEIAAFLWNITTITERQNGIY